MDATYRKLSRSEIDALTANGCSSEDWDKIETADGFDPSLVSSCRFEGRVKIGRNVTIKNVQASIANYIIGDNVVIRDIESLRTKGLQAFGNGTMVSVLNEAGGRGIRIYDTITAQTAYIAAMYRHRPKTVKAINDLIDIYVSSVESDMGTIGKGSKILNCGTLKNIRVGEHAVIHGARDLRNGTVNSSFEAPTLIGWNVIARDFITATSAEITDGAVVEKCFVGQGCVISKGFTAENSLFFANSVCLNGEACSIFAGPYTVTHHKSTLLIGGMFSFYNAGSGSNQSNHYYRLGPVHQGVLERGVKTTSSSYILFPARIGAFSIVKGRHNQNIDTSALPFSYIIEGAEGSVAVPAANMVSVGAVRDAMKWPRRDARKGTDHSDLVNFEMLNPYTVNKIREAVRLLKNLEASGNRDYVSYNNILIKRSSVKRAVDIYNTAIDKYIGGILAQKLEGSEYKSLKDISAVIDVGSGSNYAKWADMAGMIAPVDTIDNILDGLDSRHCGSLGELQESLSYLHENYRELEWGYVVELISEITGKAAADISLKDIISILERWKTSVAEIDRMLYEDARKEFLAKTMISYGIDGDEEVKKADFASVRGSFEDNPFVLGLAAHTEKSIRTADRLIEELKRL